MMVKLPCVTNVIVCNIFTLSIRMVHSLCVCCWFLFSSSFCSFSLHHFYPCSCFIFLFCGTVLFFVIFVDFIRFFMVLGRSREVNTHKRRNRSESSSMKNRSNIWVFDAAFRMCVKLWTYLFDIECGTNANVVRVEIQWMKKVHAWFFIWLSLTNIGSYILRIQHFCTGRCL